MRVAFWGSSDFSMPFLEFLQREHDVIAVITNPDKPFGRGMSEIHRTPVKEFALSNGIPALQPEDLKDGSFINSYTELRPEIAIIVSYGKIIPENLLKLAFYHTINVHASLLPELRGASPIQYALMEGKKMTGNTVQFVSKKMDCGHILAQSRVEIAPEDDYLSLQERLSKDGVELLKDVLPRFDNKTLEVTPQDDTKATYCKLIKKEDGQVDFTAMTAEEIFNRYRAFKHWPGIYCKNQRGENLLLTKIGLETGVTKTPGMLLEAGKPGYW